MRHQHMEKPCSDGHDGLTQCQINSEFLEDMRFGGGTSAPPVYCPERVKDKWKSLKGASWKSEYAALLNAEANGVMPMTMLAPYVRAISDNLSFPMTILRGLDVLYDDDAWSRKDTLTIHVVFPFYFPSVSD